MENSYADQYFSLLGDLASVKDADGNAIYQPMYGGFGASEMKWNSMQNQLSNYMNFAIAQKTNDTNLQLAREQNDWNLAQWHRQNEYNSPAHQAQLMRDAGLSAAAAAQGVSGVPASPLQSADLANQQIGNAMQAAPYGANGFDKVLSTVGNIVGAARAVAALRKENVEAKTAEQTQSANVDSILTERDAKVVALKQAQEDLHQSILTNPYHARSIAYKAQADSYMPEISRLTMEDWKLKVKTAEEYFGWIPKYHDKQLNEIQSEIDKNLQEVKESQSRVEVNKSAVGVNNATISNINADTENKRETKKVITQEFVGKVVENALKRFGAPEDPTLKFGALVASGVLKAKDVGEFLKAAKSYVESSGREFNTSTPALRDIFLYSLNPGAGAGANTPVWSHGTVTKPLDWLKGTIGRYTPFEQKPY